MSGYPSYLMCSHLTDPLSAYRHVFAPVLASL
jgi:hypothetical protein